MDMNTYAFRTAAIAAGDDTQPLSVARSDAALLSALEAALHHTIERLTAVSGRVTEQVLTLGDAAGTGLIVTLQELDRLQQEFGALGGVLSHCVDSWCGSNTSNKDDHGDPIATVTLADLKCRLSNRLRSEVLMMSTQADAASEDIF